MKVLRRIGRAIRIRSARMFPARLRHVRFSAPVATLTFDDFARSAWLTGGPIAEEAGARATYFACGGMCRQTQDGVEYFTEADLAALHARGHEAACHTFGHLHLSAASNERIEGDLARNARFLRGVTGERSVPSFAYPFGEASIRTKRMAGRHFRLCRGIEPGINSGWMDLAQLRAVCLEPHILERFPISLLVDEVCAKKGWLIFVTHDVSGTPTPYGCTPAVLREALEAVRRAGVEFRTFRDMQGVLEPAAAPVPAPETHGRA
jgi:peptidoglycan/xylan/chitin deacetylase (PgdA/CDA1 family)